MTPEHAARYGAVARGFHWLVAALVTVAFAAGVTMLKLDPGSLQNQLFDLHRSLGFIILVIMMLRLLWRLTHPAPPLPPTMPAIQRFAALVAHWLLYGLILIQPIIGWLGTNAFGAPISIFGLFTLPAIISRDAPLATILFGSHQAVSYAIFALVALHIVAALFHTFGQKDGLMKRMW